MTAGPRLRRHFARRGSTQLAQPTLDLQRDVTEFLVAQIGNPQIRPGRWAGAEKESALIRRWLARASLKVFFDLIADHALDQHWKYREAFWSACLLKGAIDDAWLALGANVHASARARQDLGSAFGRLEGAGASGDQSVLLLRHWIVAHRRVEPQRQHARLACR